NNPNTLLLVNATGSNNPNIQGQIVGQISHDGGKTWSTFPSPGLPAIDTAPFFGPGGVRLTTANSPSVAISRTGTVYVAYTMTTADFTTAGQLIVTSFSLNGGGALTHSIL